MDLHPDFRDLLAEFDRAEVRFALLGGYAVAFYGRPRATKDLDLLVSQSDSEVVYLGVPPVRIDILRRDQLSLAEPEWAQAAADLAKLRRDDPMRGAMAELVVREAFVRQVSGTGPASKDDAMFEEEFQRFKRELQTAAQQEGERLGRQEGERLGRQEGERLGRQEGERLGRQEGERLGVEKGQRLLVERLRARFGSLDETASKRLQSASEEQLTSMALRIGQAASLEELFREE